MAKMIFDNGLSQTAEALARSSYLGSVGRFIPNIVFFVLKNPRTFCTDDASSGTCKGKI